MDDSAYSRLKPYLASDTVLNWEAAEIPTCPIPVYTRGMQANSYFFGHSKWGKEYFVDRDKSR